MGDGWAVMALACGRSWDWGSLGVCVALRGGVDVSRGTFSGGDKAVCCTCIIKVSNNYSGSGER